ncbi:MAG TPA: sigma-70 family RNA polymerase sigma factor [Mycobacterium sp.]|uniref:RNA polymerase sigma factor n=1 Tax=Mycobacterium sp. TaxID=1785 RepID=UPI002D34E350|nr:sigma-70 family RNA polymerase sigma factor [Mycobacterium sp.]HZU45691.1 sigma-70 family RNA polymerase sigma factor [Mycobacterium sp.]
MDDEALLTATAAGDADAFAAFYRRHLGLVLGFCMRATGDREAAADLAAEVFAAALSACGRYHAEYDTAAPWLIGIAHNKLKESQRRAVVQDGMRRRLRMRPLELGEDDLERVESLASTAESAVLAAVEQLPQAERDAVRARIVEERAYDELAIELRCSESVVRQRVSRGLTRIRAQMSKQAEKGGRP